LIFNNVMGRIKKYFTEEEKLEAKRRNARAYTKRNKVTLANKAKEWYNNHKEEKKTYYELNKRVLNDDEKVLRANYKKKWVENNKAEVKKYNEDNKDRIKAVNDEWVRNNPDKRRVSMLKFKKNNPERVKDIRNKSARKRKLSEPLYKITCNIRSIISKLIRKGGYIKVSKTSEILGCSFDEFKTYIELQWEPWMNWGNYGLYSGEECYGWDIDHIIPMATAITENEVIILNHYTNLQPLCSYINRIVKRGKITAELSIDF